MCSLASLNPPKAVINRMEAICANFLQGDNEYGYKYHWIAWKNCCRPTNEGGLGIRNIHDFVYGAL